MTSKKDSGTKKSVVFWDIKQGSDEWLALRKCFLTASDFATILGWNPYKTMEEHMRELYSGNPVHKPNKRQVQAMQWGTTHEDEAIFEYGLLKFGMDEDTWPMTHPGIVVDYNGKLAASPDRFVGEDGIVEAKCPFSRCFYKDDIPLHHKAQLLGLLGITGRQYVDYVCWIPQGGIKIRRMDFTDELKHEWFVAKDILESYVTLHEDAYKPHRALVLEPNDDEDEEDGFRRSL